jgi:hypothetical protein
MLIIILIKLLKKIINTYKIIFKFIQKYYNKMEINFKINFPSISENEGQNLTNDKFPKSLNISYFIDFGKKTPAGPSDKIVFNINDDKKVKVIETKNEQREENNGEKISEGNIKEKKEGDPTEEDVHREEDAQGNEMKKAKKNDESASIPPKNVNLPPVLIEKEKENDKGYAEEITEDIYVIGIKEDISEEDLKKTFSFYGDVVECKIFRDKFTQKIKGSGIVKFKEKKSAYNDINDEQEVICKGYPLKLRYSRRNRHYGEKEETRYREEKKFIGKIRERIKEKEDGKLLYTQKW